MTAPADRSALRAVRHSDQLPLPIFGGPRYAAAEFQGAPSNAEARAWLSRTADWPNRRLALWGEPGCGKTHLLRVWAERAGAAPWSGPSLSGLPDLPAAGIALDDADAVPDQQALFHLLNAAGEAGLPVLLAAREPPARWAVTLPDLASRLRAITAVEVGAPEDELLRKLLRQFFAERQLIDRTLADEGIRRFEAMREWMMRRLPRNPAVLGEAVARLDAASLGRHRIVSIPLAAEVLADLLKPDEISGTQPPPSRDDPPLL